jgi:hypothetical protein
MPILTIVDATWATPFSDHVWAVLDGLKRAASKEGDLLALGPVLPDEEDARTAEAVVHRRDDELHWALAVGPPPSAEPPTEVKEHDAKLGGRRGLSALLLGALPGGAPGIGAFRIRCFLPETGFRCPFVPASVGEGSAQAAALRLGEARLEQVGFRFENGAAGIEELAIVYLHLKKEYSLNVRAKGPLKLKSARWLPFADDVVETAASTLFAPVEGGT